MNYKGVRTVLALVLAALTALTVPGCAARNLINAVANGIQAPLDNEPSETNEPSPSAWASPSQTLPDPGEDNTEEAAADRVLVPFPDMLYTRPSVDITTRALNSIADQIRASGGDRSAISDLIGEANSIYDSFETESALAMIHDAMDRTDPYWSEQNEFCRSASARIIEAYSQVEKAYYDAAGPEASGSAETLYDVSGMVELLDEHSRLSTQYQSLLSTLTADMDGVTFTYPEITDSWENEVWHEQNARTVGEVYVELLKVRRRIAEAAGYPDYVTYVFDISESGYTREMVESLLTQIQEKLVPVNSLAGSAGIYPELSLTEDQMFDMLRRWLPQLDESMSESLDLMTQYKLYDFSVGPYKDPVAFTTYLPSYAAPFLMLSFTGDYDAFSDTLHEFGHFNNYAADPTAYTESPDIGEVFSTALPLLCSKYFDEQFGSAGAEPLRRRMLSDCLSTFPYQAYFVGFELAAYSLPEDQITYENLCAISEQQWYRFGQYASPMASVDWTSTIHLVDSPFYVMSYIVATDIAMQIWEQSLTDQDAAMNTYYELMENASEGMEFMENITAAGLASPFSEDEISKQAGYFTAILLMGQSPEQAAGAAQTVTAGEPAPPETAPPVPAQTAVPESTPEPAATEEPQAETSGPRIQTYFGYSDGNYVIPLG